ncbi:TetR/AcrR family transcriptional regulator [Jiulongibacter sp. NS-SX5]|uniref:TetR/AcrR family transcriptional regulator n=1 Tax=Jiulongibacter sp. NS-SX5 TaxID=3463854 RepID=UPI004058E243
MRSRDESKELLVRQKALELLVNSGFDGFSMHKLAKAAKVSPGTLYIYFKDKEDLILSLADEVSQNLIQATFKGFNNQMDLETGLWVQWKNRSDFRINSPLEVEFFDLIVLSPYRERLKTKVNEIFSHELGGFIEKAIESGEMEPMSHTVFWSLAFAPLNNLTRFHLNGKGLGGRPFSLSEKDLKEAFDLVIRALKKQE